MVIAGAGVAGLEALLVLRALAADLVEIELIAPTDRFVYRPLLVAEPFGIGTATEIDLAPIVAETGARHLRDALASVEPEKRVVHTTAGADVGYDALLVPPSGNPIEDDGRKNRAGGESSSDAGKDAQRGRAQRR